MWTVQERVPGNPEAEVKNEGYVVIPAVDSREKRIQKGSWCICCINATHIPDAQAKMWFI